MALDKKNYNTTDLDPEKTFEKHVFHRDQFAHYLRWTHILKMMKIGQRVVDYGCGNGNLLEVLYRNRYKAEKYIGIDIRDCAKEHLKKLDWSEFIVEDLVKPRDPFLFEELEADHVVSFEVLEHVGKQNGLVFMENFKACGKETATYYLSTPNYDERVGAAGNHTYDSGDGRGKAVQEYSYEEIHKLCTDSGFYIVDAFGTFASQRDYKPEMNQWQKEMFNHLTKYYDSNLVSNLMAPFFPSKSRNTLWILKRAEDDLF